jgi:hypothetical protein
MKKLFMLTLLCGVSIFISTTIIGQQEDIVFTPDVKELPLEGKSSSWDLHVNSKTSKSNAVITLTDKERVFHYLVDTSFHMLKHYAFNRAELSEGDYYNSNKYNFILQTVIDSTFSNFMSKPSSGEVFCETLDFAEESSKFFRAFNFGSKEDLVTAFEMNEKICFITVPNKSNKLRFYTFGQQDFKEVELTMKDAPEDFDIVTSLKNLEPINADDPVNLDQSKHKAKLYINKNYKKVLLTFDNNYRYTVAYTIDLENFATTSKTLLTDFHACNDVANPIVLQSNSYYIDNKIIRAIFCPENYSIQVKDLATDSTLQQFTANRSGGIAFASSNLIRKEEHKKLSTGLLMLAGGSTIRDANSGPFSEKYTKWNAKNENSTSKAELSTKDFFKAINRSTLALTAVRYKDWLVIKTGEVHNLVTGGVGGAGFPMMNGGGFGAAPVFGVGLRAAFPIKSGQAETYFTTVLNANNLNFIPEVEPETKYDQIERLHEPLPQTKLSEATFELNGKTYLMKWYKEANQFVIEEIK